MNSIETIIPAVSILEKKEIPYALLHCTNVYPTPAHLVRLGALAELEHHFPKAVIGLSDHSLSNHACLGAAALGASILERHFTDRPDRKGPDINCSMTPEALDDLISGSKIMKEMRGGGKGRLLEEEVTAEFAFSSVCTVQAVKKGESFSSQNIWLKRPAGGDFSAIDYQAILGKVSSRNIEIDEQLKQSDII